LRAFAVPGGDLIGQASAIDGDTIEIHRSAFGFGPSPHRRPTNPGSSRRGKFQEYPKTFGAPRPMKMGTISLRPS
jgi:hypothetical protein